MQQPRDQRKNGGGGRAFSGLGLVFALSILSFASILLTFPFLGGRNGWSPVQFAGLFGVLEIAAGLANIISPNIWRLPVAEVQTKRSTRIHFAASAMLIPHWGGAARAAAGLALVIAAAVSEGASIVTVDIALVAALLAIAVVAVSAVFARAGVARPDLDVIQFVVKYAGKEHEVPALSIGASIFQMILSIVTIPIVKTVPPSALYRPEIGASGPTIAACAGAAVVSCALAAFAWRGRIDREASRDQQREAEEFA